MGRPLTVARRLAGSASGSGVFEIGTGPTRAVLKLTTQIGWREAARRELRCYRELGGRLPVRMPRLLDAVDSDSVTAMLLSAHEPAPPADRWTSAQWIDVAAQLGRLHTTAERPSLPAPDWLAAAVRDGPPDGARRYWRGTDAADAAARVLDSGPWLERAMAGSPSCLVHGDCHVGNLLLDGDGSHIWADWQVVGVGCGEADLGFLWVRAETDGATLPRAAMVEAYAMARGTDPDVSRNAAHAAEAAILAFAWPEYASWNDQPARDRITRRLRVLVESEAVGGLNT